MPRLAPVTSATFPSNRIGALPASLRRQYLSFEIVVEGRCDRPLAAQKDDA